MGTPCEVSHWAEEQPETKVRELFAQALPSEILFAGCNRVHMVPKPNKWIGSHYWGKSLSPPGEGSHPALLSCEI